MIAIYTQQTGADPDVDRQIELCLRACTGEYTPFIDKKVAGKNKERPALAELTHAVERGEIDKVVVYRLDFMFNTLTEFSHFWQVLSENDTEFVSVSEDFDTSSRKGREILKVVTEFANIERENIAKRIRDNYRERAMRGIYPGGPAPFGFEIGRTTFDGKPVSMLVPNEKISVVREIFELYAGGVISLGKLASYLHEQGIAGIKRSGWDNVSISRILHNPVYVKADKNVYQYFKSKGIVIYNGEESFAGQKACWLLGKRAHEPEQQSGSELLVVACHDGVIEPEVFLKCQKRLDANKKLKNTGNGAYTWLSGLVKCGYCGYSMQAVSANGGRYIYLICTGKTNFKVCRTKFRSPHVETIEPYVQQQIDARILELRKDVSAKREELQEIDALKLEIAQTEQKISNLVDELADSGGAVAGYLNNRIETLDADKAKLLARLKGKLERVRSIELPDCTFASLDFQAKKNLAHSLIHKVSITKGKIDIEWVPM